MEKVLSNNMEDIYCGVIGLRKLSCSFYKSVDYLIREHKIFREKLLFFCEQDASPHLQMETAWLLTNYLGGPSDQCALIAPQIIPIFLQIIKKCRRKEIIEQAIWGLGNLSGDGT